MSLSRLIFLTIVAGICAWFLRAFAFEGVYIASASMEPTLPVGTHAILDKVTYRSRAPRRGDIVVFAEPVPPHAEMVKRVIATPGDTVELRGKQLYVNGELQSEPYIKHTRAAERLQGDNLGPLQVPVESIFVLGDNRDESDDSSVWKDSSGDPVHFVPFTRVRGLLRGFY